MHEVRTFALCKAFLFDMFAFFSSLENYFGFRTTNVQGKMDHPVSLRWNKRFWTFLKRRVFFWLCIRLIYEFISPGWIKTRLYSVINSYGYFLYMPRFITFAEPALSLSSVKETYCCYNASEWTNLCAYYTFSEIEGQQAYSRSFFCCSSNNSQSFFIFHYIVLFSSALWKFLFFIRITFCTQIVLFTRCEVYRER